MSAADRRTPKQQAVIDEAERLSRESKEAHHPGWLRTARNGMHAWSCQGCDYMTGYARKTGVSKQIIAHCKAKNEAVA